MSPATSSGRSGPKVATLAFHEVTDDPTATGFQRPGAVPFTLSRASFERHLEQIAQGPSRPALVTTLDLSAAGRHVLLTFDDGGKSALYAADALSERGWRGHFFIVTGLIGNRTFLGKDEIRRLHGAGHLIGSHSETHPDIFRELPVWRMREEWRESANRLADLLGVPCRSASVPGGEISRVVLESAAAGGFDFLFTVEPEPRPRRVQDCWVLGRCLIKARTPPAQVNALVNFQGWQRALAIRRLKMLARRSCPLLYRNVVSRRTREWKRGVD
ncbi:MAG: polysaccharide deacetylase family protein [Gemmatimonadales bacterium]